MFKQVNKHMMFLEACFFIRLLLNLDEVQHFKLSCLNLNLDALCSSLVQLAADIVAQKHSL